MVNLSDKQKEFLDELLRWTFSEDIKKEVFCIVCNELERLIDINHTANMQQRSELLIEMLSKEKNAYHNNGNESLINNLLDRVRSYIETHRKYRITNASLFDYIDDIFGAKEFLISLFL